MKLRRRKYKSGNVAWQLDLGKVDGKRLLIMFETKAEAEKRAGEVAAERKRFGDVAAGMSHERRLQIAQAEAKLEAAGVTLEQALVWAMERGTAVKEHRTLAEVRDSFIREKERTGCRERTVRQLKVSLGSFVRGRELTPASMIVRSDVEAWLAGNGWSAATQKNYLGDLRGLFRWAKDQRTVAEDPTKGVTPAQDRSEREIAVLAPEQVEALFGALVMTERRVFDRSAQTYAVAPVYRSLERTTAPVF